MKKQFSNEDINAALELVHSEYFTQVVALLSHKSEVKDLEYVKVPVVTPEGGTYLVSILHVDGPKLDVNKLKETSEQQEIKNPQE